MMDGKKQSKQQGFLKCKDGKMEAILDGRHLITTANC